MLRYPQRASRVESEFVILRRFTARKVITLCVFAFAVFVSLSLPPTSTSALTTVPTKMNFQGRLTDASGNIMPNGTYNMRLRLFTVSTGGASVWSEDRLVSASQGVTVTNGLFSIKLGDITSLPASHFASGGLYLEVELPTPATATSSSPTWTEGPMTPRNQMATSAYAYNAETLDGLDSAAFGQLSSNNTWSGTNTFTGDYIFNNTGSVYEIHADEIIVDALGNGFTINNSAFNVLGTIASSSVRSDSASAFQAIANASGRRIFNVDSANEIVSLGHSTADAVAAVFVLDTKNTSGDPTGASATDGAMYYNSNAGKFRCYQSGSWTDCIGAGGGSTLQAAYDASTGGTTPEIKIDSTRGGVDIQNANTGYSGSLFTVRGANAGGLGSALFDVSTTAGTTVTGAFTQTNGTVSNLIVGNSSTASVTIGYPGGNVTPPTTTNTIANTVRAPAAASANGYLYVLGGQTGNSTYTSTIQYGSVMARGGLDTIWTTSGVSLPVALAYHSTVVYNNYIYVIGGYNGSTQSNVYYSRVNPDGSINAWQTATNSLPTALNSFGSVVVNGYVYVIGGRTGNFTGQQSTVYYAKLSADGSVGSWQTANALPAARGGGAAVVANGKIYLLGGDSNGSTGLTTVYEAKVNSDGSLGTWAANSKTLLAGITGHSAVVSNGYVYTFGGSTTNTIRYLPTGAFVSGATGSWATSAFTLPTTINNMGTALIGNTVYLPGGFNGSYFNTVKMTHLGGQINIGGTLDLSYTNSFAPTNNNYDSVTDATNSGSAIGGIIAGSVDAYGALTVSGQARLKSSLSVGDAFSVGSGIFDVETDLSIVRVGSSVADTTGVVLVLDTKNDAGDPTGTSATNGAMYYNSNAGKFRCYQSGSWVDCIAPAPSSITLGSDQTNSTTTAADVTGLSFSLAAATKYHYKFVLINQTNATTTGLGYGVTYGGTSGTSSWCVDTMNVLTTGTAGGFGSYCSATGGDASTTTTAVDTANTNYETVMEGYIQTTTAGTLQLRFKSEVAASNAVVKAGSWGILTPVQ